MSDPVPTITYKGIQIPIEFGYKEVITDFKNLGLNLLNIFTDDQVMLSIKINDAVMLQVWYFYVKPHCESFEEAVESLTPKQMHTFKEAFWQQVINFIEPTMRPLALAMADQLKDRLKSPKSYLDDSSETSSPKQE